MTQLPTIAAIHRRRRLEVVLSLALLLVSLTLVGVTLASLVDQRAESATQTLLPAGRTSFHVYQADTCVGSLESSVTEGRLRQWQLRGVIHLSEQGTTVPARLQLDSYFNPLHQMFQFELLLEYGELAVTIHAENVHPIDIEVSGRTAAQTFSKSLRLPGPVLLEAVPASDAASSSTHYRLQYHYATGLVPEPARRTGDQLLAGLNLRVETASESSQCAGVLTIDQLRHAVSALSPLVLQQGGLPPE